MLDVHNYMDLQAILKRHPRRTKVAAITSVALIALLVIGLVYKATHKPVTTVSPPEAFVTMTKDGFVPGTIKVAVGTKVTWQNLDVVDHQVAADPYPTHESLPGLFSSEPTAPKKSYSYTFSKSGTFTYQDFLNPAQLKGTVVVEK